MAKYRVRAAGKAKLNPGAVIDESQLAPGSADSLRRLGILEPYTPKKRKPKSKSEAKRIAIQTKENTDSVNEPEPTDD